MTNSLWDLTEVDADEQRVLSQMERDFLMTEDSGSYTNAEMKRRVAAKVAKLPDRFQQLIDDISLLYYRGYLDKEESEIWENLLNINNRSRQVRDAPVARTRRQIPGNETELGFEVGTLIRMIHKEEEEEEVPTDLVWGSIIGLIGEPSDEWEFEAGRLVDLFEELEDYYEWRLVSAGTQADEGDGLQEERDEIRDILQEWGVAPAPPLVNAVLDEYTKNDLSDRFETSEKSWKADPSQTEHPTPPDKMPSEAEMRQTNFENIVSKLTDQTPLSTLDQIAKNLREDAFCIQRREWRGVDPDQAFHFIGDNGETQVQELDQTETKGQNNVTTALRRLSYNDSDWVNRPVLEENQGENSYWELTSYGKLLYNVRFKHNCSTNWLYDYVVNPDRVGENMSEIISETIQVS